MAAISELRWKSHVPIRAETADKLAHICDKEHQKNAHASSPFPILRQRGRHIRSREYRDRSRVSKCVILRLLFTGSSFMNQRARATFRHREGNVTNVILEDRLKRNLAVQKTPRGSPASLYQQIEPCPSPKRHGVDGCRRKGIL